MSVVELVAKAMLAIARELITVGIPVFLFLMIFVVLIALWMVRSVSDEEGQQMIAEALEERRKSRERREAMRSEYESRNKDE